MKKTLSVYGTCDIGLKKPNNEDMIMLGDEIFRDGSRRCEFDADKKVAIAIADGIGGFEKGEIASEIVLCCLRDFFSKLPDDLQNEDLQKAFNAFADETHSSIEQGGSTLVGILVYQGKVFRYHAGDSRLYLLRNGGLRRLTIDHSLKEAGGDLNAKTNLITNSFGGGKNVFIEFAEIEQPFIAGDIYLLSSDGLHDLVPPDVITDTLLVPETECDEAYAEKLLALAKAAGGKDNISIITIKISEDNNG